MTFIGYANRLDLSRLIGLLNTMSASLLQIPG